jgi:uncharacterized protein YbbC (DUF1343 family)
MRTGLERFLQSEHRKYRKQRLAFLCHQASVDGKLRHLRDLVLDPKLKIDVRAFFGPQHGINGEKQDNMIESADSVDPVSKKPVYSLYGKTREPLPSMLEDVDVLFVDLQDIGSRVYTFVYTMANCMRVAKRLGKKVVVLDRPNPVGGIAVEGNRLDPKFASFVGQFPIVVRHGMTMGELALMFNDAFEIGCDLDVIKLAGWNPRSFGDGWGRDWVPPSPNIPSFPSTLLFSGMVFFEGTNVSEGRGTTKPFEYVGAPFIDADKLARTMNGKKLPGVYFRPVYFQPTYQKGKDQVCGGVHTHVTDRKKFDSFRTGAELLWQIAQDGRGAFAWKQPPYEYEHVKMPVDLIAGTPRFRELVDRGAPLREFLAEAKKDSSAFLKARKPYLLYPRR